MHYTKDEKDNLEVGDLIIHNDGFGTSVEVITFVGNEGVVLLRLGGIIGMLERYVTFRKLPEGWPRIIHKLDAEEYIEFLGKMRKGDESESKS